MMEFAMNWSIVLLVLGAIVCFLGMAWSLVDGRLWNNPGETMAHVGIAIAGVASLIMLVVFLILTVQCALNNGTCQL